MVLPTVSFPQLIQSSSTNFEFASGIPHSIQALDDGVEFLLVFDDGDFNEDNTFLATEVFMHQPVRSSINTIYRRF